MYYLGIIFVCFGTDCYFLKAPVLYKLEEQCNYELATQLDYLTNMGFYPHGQCFEVELPGVEI